MKANIILYLVSLLLFAFMLFILIFPELFDTVAKYQLKLDLQRGDKIAIEYYENRYLHNGIELFEDEICYGKN